MEQTNHVQLNLWEGEDRILREDFNADNVKTEDALVEAAEEQAALAQALAGCGNCKLVYGSYTGTGKYGSSSKNKLTFERKPIYVAVFPAAQSGYNDIRLQLLRNVPYAIGLGGNSSYTNTVSWTDTDVQWYSSTSNAGCQFNEKNEVYHYLALLETDA